METLARAANRGSVSTGPYQIDNSLKFERSSNEAVETTNQAGGNRKTWTFSAWIKRTALSEDYHTIFGAEYTNIQIMANDRPRLVLYNGTSYYADPEMLMRDTSAWYHIVVQLDTTQSTAADRVKWWINGERVTTFNNSTYTNMTQNTDFSGVGQPSSYGSGGWLRLGRFFSGDEGFDGYMADVYYLNGTAAEADDFGEYDEDSGIWIPKEYTGSGYGTQGFHYKFDNASNLGEDSSGEGHDATSLSNITAADQATDTPTNNFCTLNPLWRWTQTMGVSDGATKVNNTVIAWGGAKGSIGVNSGKWYWEHGSFSGNDTMFGIQNQAGGGNTQAYLDAYTLAIQANNNVIQFTDPSNRTEAFSKTFSISDIWGVALDLDNNTIAFYRNGSIVNSAFSIDGLIGNGEFFPFVAHYGQGLNSRVNFGGYTGITISSAASDENGYGTFEYAPPTGYYALCTKNLAEFG